MTSSALARLAPLSLAGAGVLVLVASGALPLPSLGGPGAAPEAPHTRVPEATFHPDVVPDGAAEEILAVPTVYSIAMHMHGSISEGDGSMAWHTAQAVTNNIDVLWWSDHDVFYYPEASPSVDGYDFESGARSAFLTSWPSTENIYVEWATLDEDNQLPTYDYRVNTLYAHSGTYGGRLQGTASADGVEERVSYYLTVSPRFQFKPLMGVLNLSFWVRPYQTDANGELQIVVPLNGAHSGDEYAVNDNHRKIIFYHGSTAHPALSEDGLTIYVPITASTGSWTQVTANLTDLATAAWGEAVAVDLHGEMITSRLVISNGATVKYDLDDFAWTMDVTGDALVDEQANFLATLGSDPLQLLGQEVSPLEEGHFNVFGSSVPILPYSTSDLWDAASMTDWVHGYGGLVSYNHMFGVSMQRNSAADREAAIETQIDALLDSDAWGVDLLEIGYRQRGGLIDDFLAVWDALGMAGLYKTGIGAMDLHDELDYADFTNNFVTFVAARALTEASINAELSRGAAWFGDPTYFPSGHVTMAVTSSEYRNLKQGSVVIGRTTPIDLVFNLSWAPDDCVISQIENGVETASWSNGLGQRWSTTATIDPTGGKVVRWQVESSSGYPIAYSNPVYFIDTDPGDVPSNRRINATVRPPR